MARFISRYCENSSCSEFNKKNIYSGELEKALHQVVGLSGNTYRAKCEKCGNIIETEMAARISNMRYPQYNASLDKTFNSRHDEKSFAKDNKLEAIYPSDKK